MTIISRTTGSTAAPVLRGMESRSTDLKEALQEAVVNGILASAGCNPAKYKIDDGIDLHVTHSIGVGQPEVIDMQLKAVTGGWNAARTQISASLTQKRYNAMRAPIYSMPMIVVIMDLPASQDDWSRVAGPYSLFKHRCYWVNLTGAPERAGTNTVSVSAPLANVFDDVAVCEMFSRIRAGGRP